jgi:hypothetical protein
MLKLNKIILITAILVVTLPVFAAPGEVSFSPNQPPPNDWLSYANFLIPFALSVAAILALIQLTVAGLQMMTASEHMREEAKERVSGAIIGLLLALGIYLILKTINPDLLRLDLNPSRLNSYQIELIHA